MDDDRQLLQRFVQENSQEAFAALTARYLSLVYSTCRRELDDADLAEDVTQAVFLVLARKAPRLDRSVVLSGWLFQTARFAAKNARLQEARRKAYEQKAAETLREQPMETEDAAWTEIEPLLNQSLAALRDGERECVLLRFFQGMSFAEAGAALGVSEEAARKRVLRALDRMRQFFVKNGVIIPSTALAVLLTAHAAKAAPAGLTLAIAQSTTGVLAGHATTAVLAGSHAYHLSEGTLKAMKIAQIKLAVGIAAASFIGFSFYAASRAVTVTSSHPAALLLYVPKPGHILQQVPVKTLTAAQIAERCRQTYASLKTYQGTSTVNDQTMLGGTPHDYQSTATIRFVRPGKISAQGTDTSGHPFGYVSDAGTTEQTYPTVLNWGLGWQKVNGDEKTSSTEAAIAGATGIAQWSATTIPALLIGAAWGFALPLNSGGMLDRAVREDAVDGQKCYVLTAHLTTSQRDQEASLWIDEKTFLVRRYAWKTDGFTQPVVLGGQSFPAATIKMYADQRFINERINQPIPDSAFALPPVE